MDASGLSVLTDTKKLGMLIVQDQVWNCVTVNRAERKSTWYFMDEFRLLLKEEQTAAYSVEIWKRFRKWGGIPTGFKTLCNKKQLHSPLPEKRMEKQSVCIAVLPVVQCTGDLTDMQSGDSPQPKQAGGHNHPLRPYARRFQWPASSAGR